MAVPVVPDDGLPGNGDGPAPTTRHYDSPVRRRRAAETRERILAAGSALVHGFSSWDWKDLTFRAVADRAGVSERTVYRHFATERQLHDAVMARLEAEAGLSYERLRLDDLQEFTGRFLASLPSFEAWRGATEDLRPPFVNEDQRRRAALLRAVAEAAGGDWSDDQRLAAAAIIDALSNLPTFEHLIGTWKLDADQAALAVTWGLGLLIEAVRGRPPGAGPPAPPSREQAPPAGGPGD